MKTSDCKFAGCLYFTSSALARKVEKQAQESWKKFSLSPSHGYLLMLVLEEPGIQPSILADQLQLQPSTVSRLLEKLESKKLLVRTSEGKITNVYPTPKAKELFPKMKECVQEYTSYLTSLLGKEEKNRLVQQLGKVADKLSD